MEALAAVHGEATLSEVAAASGLTRPTAHRILNTLERVGWVRKSEGGRYVLTIRVFAVGASGPDVASIRDVARPVLEELATETGDTAYLLVPNGNEAICLDRVEGPHPVRVHAAPVGGTVAYSVGGAPFAILAWKPDLVDEVIPRRHRAGVRRELEEVRTRGYAFHADSLIPGVSALGAPVFGQHGEVVGGVSVVGTNDRFQGDGHDQRSRAVVAAAERLTYLLNRRGIE